MNIQRRTISAFVEKNRSMFFLAGVWLLGIFLGAGLADVSGSAYAVVASAARLRPNLFVLYGINALPAAAVVFLIARRSRLLLLLLFLYGLLRGFCGMCTVFAFAGGSWLARSLLLFSSGTVSVLMWYLIFSSVSRTHLRKLACISALLISAVTFLDYFVASPFLTGIA